MYKILLIAKRHIAISIHSSIHSKQNKAETTHLIFIQVSKYCSMKQLMIYSICNVHPHTRWKFSIQQRIKRKILGSFSNRSWRQRWMHGCCQTLISNSSLLVSDFLSAPFPSMRGKVNVLLTSMYQWPWPTFLCRPSPSTVYMVYVVVLEGEKERKKVKLSVVPLLQPFFNLLICLWKFLCFLLGRVQGLIWWKKAWAAILYINKCMLF